MHSIELFPLQVTSVQPKRKDDGDGSKAKKQRDRNGGFEIGKDGRLIIKDSDDEEDEEEGPKKLPNR